MGLLARSFVLLTAPYAVGPFARLAPRVLRRGFRGALAAPAQLAGSRSALLSVTAAVSATPAHSRPKQPRPPSPTSSRASSSATSAPSAADASPPWPACRASRSRSISAARAEACGRRRTEARAGSPCRTSSSRRARWARSRSPTPIRTWSTRGWAKAASAATSRAGDGVWKSTDAGKTWAYAGLKETQQIPRVRVHPRNPDLVYVAALGHTWGPKPRARHLPLDRTAGKTWKKVLFVDDKTGASDLVMDPVNPRVLYAGFWQVGRKPWALESGGPGGGLWKTTDGGDTWKKLAGGLPEGVVGRVGVAVSRGAARARLGHRRGREGRRLPHGRRRRDVEEAERREQAPAARLVLLAHLRRPEERRRRLRAERRILPVRRRRQDVRSHPRRRTATTTTSGSTRTSRAA